MTDNPGRAPEAQRAEEHWARRNREVGRCYDSPLPFSLIFEQLTPESKEALSAARAAALELGYNFLGPEHLLLGLLCDNESKAARFFAALGCDVVKLREGARAALLPSQEAAWPPGAKFPIAPHVATALQLAAAEAHQHQEVLIAPQYLALGLLRVSAGMSETIFSSFHIDLGVARSVAVAVT